MSGGCLLGNLGKETDSKGGAVSMALKEDYHFQEKKKYGTDVE